MAKLSRQTKETIKTIIVLIIVGVLLTAYVIYPLNKSKSMFAREDIEEFNYDSLPANEFSVYQDSLLAVDSFRVEPDGLTSLACLQLSKPSPDSLIGTVILIHEKTYTRDDYYGYVKALADLNYNVIIYDQRASGLSSGKYFGFGVQEGADLEELISTLGIRGKLSQPLTVIGFGIGADAALFASLGEQRISSVIALNPYLTTDRVIDKLQVNYDSYWFPFYRTIMFWWYKMRSGYAPTYIEKDALQAVSCPTLLMFSETDSADETVKQFIELSSPDKLTIVPRAENEAALIKVIISFMKNK